MSTRRARRHENQPVNASIKERLNVFLFKIDPFLRIDQRQVVSISADDALDSTSDPYVEIVGKVRHDETNQIRPAASEVLGNAVGAKSELPDRQFDSLGGFFADESRLIDDMRNR